MSYCISAHKKTAYIVSAPSNTNGSPASAKRAKPCPHCFKRRTLLSRSILHFREDVSEWFGRLWVFLGLGWSLFCCFDDLLVCKGSALKGELYEGNETLVIRMKSSFTPSQLIHYEWLVNKFIFNIHLHEQSGYVHLLHCSGQERHSYTLRMRIILRLKRFRENYLTPSWNFILNMYSQGWQHSSVEGVDRYLSLQRGSSESIWLTWELALCVSIV